MLEIEIEINLILTLDGIARFALSELCRHIKGLVLALDIVQGLILDLCLELDFLDGWIRIWYLPIFTQTIITTQTLELPFVKTDVN